jgi:hypothetical protein
MAGSQFNSPRTSNEGFDTHEATKLLLEPVEAGPRVDEANEDPRTPDEIFFDKTPKLIRIRTCWLCACLIFIIHFASFLRAAPKTRLFELGLCRAYFSRNDPTRIDDHGSVPEELCKKTSIQVDLAILKGWLALLSGLPGILKLAYSRAFTHSDTRIQDSFLHCHTDF